MGRADTLQMNHLPCQLIPAQTPHRGEGERRWSGTWGPRGRLGFVLFLSAFRDLNSVWHSLGLSAAPSLLQHLDQGSPLPQRQMNQPTRLLKALSLVLSEGLLILFWKPRFISLFPQSQSWPGFVWLNTCDLCTPFHFSCLPTWVTEFPWAQSLRWCIYYVFCFPDPKMLMDFNWNAFLAKGIFNPSWDYFAGPY